MDLPSCLGGDLFFSLLFPSLPDQRLDRSTRHLARRGLSLRRLRLVARLGTFLVRAHTAVVVCQRSRPACSVLGGSGSVPGHHPEFMAAGCTGGVSSLFSVVRCRGARLLRIPVGWNASRSRFHLNIFCSAGIASGAGSGAPAFSSQFVSFALGVVPHLLRVRGGQAGQPRLFL